MASDRQETKYSIICVNCGEITVIKEYELQRMIDATHGIKPAPREHHGLSEVLWSLSFWLLGIGTGYLICRFL